MNIISTVVCCALQFALIELLTALVVNSEAASYSPIITTKSGQVRGKVVQASVLATTAPVDVYQFTSIPFAEPPVGQLRFKKPEPVQPWQPRILDATRTPNACSQNTIDNDGLSENGTEDCLYLNLWVPRNILDSLAQNASAGNQRALSVFVFIHGGGFLFGSTKESTYNGTYLAGLNNVIVVTIQYRLGSLGFAYLGNQDAPGNMGLWDQLEALKWISNNIQAFGGNSSEVTIGGEDAGAASVTCHLLSPYSRPYFQRAIVQSGSAVGTSRYKSKEDALTITNIVFEQICNQTSPSEKMQCLKSAEGIRFPLTDNGLNSSVFVDVFGPLVDGDFLPRDPLKMLLSGDYNKQVSLLVGANKDEGSMFVMTSRLASEIFPTYEAPDRSLDDLSYENYTHLIEDMFSLLGGGRNATANRLLVEAVKLHYWPKNHEGAPKGAEIFKAVSDAAGDYGVLCPVYGLGEKASSDGAKVFAYNFNHRHSEHWAPDFMGVAHGDELPFMFGKFLQPPTENSLGSNAQEKQLSKTMMTYWGNFIKYGDPNGAVIPVVSQAQLRTWPPYIGRTCLHQYFELNLTITQGINRSNMDNVICGLKELDCKFWHDYITKLADQLLLTTVRPSTLPPRNIDGITQESRAKKNVAHRGGYLSVPETIIYAFLSTLFYNSFIDI